MTTDDARGYCECCGTLSRLVELKLDPDVGDFALCDGCHGYLKLNRIPMPRREVPLFQGGQGRTAADTRESAHALGLCLLLLAALVVLLAVLP